MGSTNLVTFNSQGGEARVQDRPNRLRGSEDGFTLIELLVVILIIGALAAIAIPSFLNQRHKGQDACGKAMVKQMQLAMKTYQTENQSFSGASLAQLNLIEPSLTGSTATGNCAPLGIGQTASGGSCTGTPTSQDFCVSAVSLSGNSFAIAESGSALTRTCTTGANPGGCRAPANSNGSW